MLKVNNTRVYGLEESIVAGGYPMMTDHPTGADFNEKCTDVLRALTGEFAAEEYGIGRVKSSEKLGNVPTGTGHDNFLKGIIVQADITYPQYWTPQFQRYSFHDIVSSNSKMHRITKMAIRDVCNKYVDEVVMDNLEFWVTLFNAMTERKENDALVYWMENEENFEMYREFLIGEGNVPQGATDMESYDKYGVFMKVVSNIPAGLEQFMRETTNYLQLKTIYLQRMGHKLQEDWGTYCAWCESLPHFVNLCLDGKRRFTDNYGKPLKEIHNWE